MADFDPVDHLSDLDKPTPPPSGLADRVWEAVEHEVGRSDPQLPAATPARHLGGWAGVAAAAVAVLVIGFAAIGTRGNEVTATSTLVGTTTITEPTTTAPSTTSTTLEIESAIGSRDVGFGEVEAALDRARARWETSGIELYAYRAVVECECDEAGERWHHVFDPDFASDVLTIDDLFDQIERLIPTEPDRLEVSFSFEDGHPTQISSSSAGGVRSTAIDSFHEIVFDPSPFDGTWQFVEGTIAGEGIRGVGTDGIPLTILGGFVSYPADCNEVGRALDIYGEHFGVGSGAMTAMGCSEYTDEATLFDQAITRADSITRDATSMTLTGPGVELHFTLPQTPNLLGTLPLAAAGDMIAIDPPDDRTRSDAYTLGPSLEWPAYATYLLTAAETATGATSWEAWNGIPTDDGGSVDGPGPDYVTLPDTIGVADWYLCSPFWQPDPFCWELPIRPPSRAWFMTAGPNGVILHDANGTSETISPEPAEMAFSTGLDDRFVVRFTADPSAISIITRDGTVDSIALGADEQLLDVGRSPDTVVLTSTGLATFSTRAFTGERTRVGPAATEARVAGDAILLRTELTTLTAIRDGSELWSVRIDEDAMFDVVDDQEVRIDRFTTYNTEGLPAFYQYLETRFLDLETGEEQRASEMEVAIPLEGDEIDEPCVRGEIADELLLCTEPDGRVVGLELEGGNTVSVAANANVATYVR